MRVALANDHAGFDLKEGIRAWLEQAGQQQIVDLGGSKIIPGDDYPDSAEALGIALQGGKADRGILICGSGVGASIAANKLHGIRASICHDIYSAHQGVEHDNMNVLVFGARVVGIELAKDLVQAFLQANFTGEARHVRRLEKIDALEQKACQ